MAFTNIGYYLKMASGHCWWDGGPMRYDYDYSEVELGEWKDKVLKIAGKVRAVYVYFNNCHQGQAVGSASLFVKMLSGEAESLTGDFAT